MKDQYSFPSVKQIFTYSSSVRGKLMRDKNVDGFDTWEKNIKLCMIVLI
jgi:hypothetical protein